MASEVDPLAFTQGYRAYRDCSPNPYFWSKSLSSKSWWAGWNEADRRARV